jgi:hypothetical protein
VNDTAVTNPALTVFEELLDQATTAGRIAGWCKRTDPTTTAYETKYWTLNLSAAGQTHDVGLVTGTSFLLGTFGQVASDGQLYDLTVFNDDELSVGEAVDALSSCGLSFEEVSALIPRIESQGAVRMGLSLPGPEIRSLAMRLLLSPGLSTVPTKI